LRHISGAALLALGCLGTVEARAEAVTVTSPDGRNTVEVETGPDGASYAVLRDGKPVIASSPLGLNSTRGTLGGAGAAMLAHKERSVRQQIELVAGKAGTVAERYNESAISLRQPGSGAIDFSLIVRAYDDGVAFRYVVPGQDGLQRLDLAGEQTRFDFPRDYDCWGFNPGRYDSGHEGEFDPVKASLIRPAHLFDAPLVCKTGEGQTTFALAQADMRDYAGAYFSGRGDGGLGVTINLAPRPDNDETTYLAVKADLARGPLVTPWRVVMLGDSPAALVQSTLIAQLASPSVIGDTSWIKPGKAQWDWWNGWAVNIPGAGINTATYKAYIDNAAAMKLQYVLIDEGWYEGSSEGPGPADVTQTVAAIDMPEIVRYAAERGIGVMVWLQWKQLDRQMDQALALYEKWGLKGIKVDFMSRNDQEMVAFYHTLLAKAAQHHLLVDLHAAYPPDGLSRTYPNYLTQEGVMGAEYNKWSSRITARHNVTLPFTRMLLGPMDYTPGGFRHLSQEEFARQRRFIAPFVQTTRGQALAMYVVFDSPLQMVADSPGAYRNADGSWADGAEFIGAVPTIWDETRVLAGDIGEYIVTARRKGRTWYLGAMTNEKGRTVSIPLDFLGEGGFSTRLWQDGADMSHLRSSTLKSHASTKLVLQLAPSGGAVAVLSPAGG
jgi:alpha-glucosidase